MNGMGQLRIGKLLEDLDAFAGTIAYKHCDDGDEGTAPLTLVTASCDRIDALGPLPPQDMVMVGACTFVGNSSMNIDLELRPEGGQGHADAPHMAAGVHTTPGQASLLAASLTFVARHPVSNAAVPVPWLHPKSPVEKGWYARGRKRQAANRAARQASLYHTLPTGNELALVHDMFVSTHGRGGGGRSSFAAAGALLGDVSTAVGQPRPIASTSMTSHYFTQPTDANIHGKVFGGLLMRKAFELAYSTAWVYTGARPDFYSLDDITFLAPVELGTLLRSTARVEYTAHGISTPGNSSAAPAHFVTVAVSTESLNPSAGDQVVTNDFHFTFKLRTGIPRVQPQSYAEAMTWLESHRRFNAGQAAAVERAEAGGATCQFNP